MIYKVMEDADLENIAQLYVEAFNGEPWNDKWTRETAMKRLDQMLGCRDSLGLVAYEEDQPVGLVLGNKEYYYNSVHFHLKELCVDRSIKGKGIGSKLLDEFMKRLQEQGVSKVLLWTLRCNEMLSFYNKKGFQVEEALMVMSCSINS